MIEFERVLEAFAALCGASVDDARADGSVVVRLAIGEVGRRLKSGAYTAETREDICLAAAAVAFYKHCVASVARDSAGFKAGDVTAAAPNADCVALAQKIRDDAIGAIAALLDGDEFMFGVM